MSKEDEEIELDENGNVIRYNEDGEILKQTTLEMLKQIKINFNRCFRK